MHLWGARILGDRVVVATWPSTSLAGLSACLWDKSRFLRSIHSSWVHSLDASWAFGRDTGSGRFLGLWGWGDGYHLDASWAFGGHWRFEGVQAGGSACRSRGLSCDWTRVRSHTGPGPPPGPEAPRRPDVDTASVAAVGVVGRVGLLLQGGFLRTPAPGHPGSVQGPAPIKA